MDSQPGTLWGREPAMVLALVQAVLALVVAFGLQLAPDQIGAILGRVIERDRTARLTAASNAELQRLVEEAEAQRLVAERANAAKTAFLAVTSHEVRTPLNAVLGLTEALAREPLDITYAVPCRPHRFSPDRIFRKQLHGIETCLDSIALRERRQDPLAQKPRAHRRERAIEHRQQRAACIAAA